MEEAELAELELYLKEKRTEFWENNRRVPNLYDVFETDRFSGLSMTDKIYTLDSMKKAGMV